MVLKAIDIANVLSTNDSKYLIDWIGYNHSLAEIVYNNNEIDRAREILNEIKPMAEKCLTENPDDKWTRQVNNEIIELLKKCGDKGK